MGKKANRIIILIILLYYNGYSQDVVTVSVYNAVEEQCNADFLNTAFMFHLGKGNHFKHRIIAVSRDLLVKYPNKSKVLLEGTKYDGIYTVRDKMNKRFSKRIDILIDSTMPIGFWKKATITLIN
jgi:3D (Asp-Asp-Asp) domain-containing protein